MEPLIVIAVLLIITSILAHIYQALDLFVYVVAVMAMVMALITFAWLQLYIVSLSLLISSVALGGLFFLYRHWRHL